MESVAGVQQAHIKTIRYLEEETKKDVRRRGGSLGLWW